MPWKMPGLPARILAAVSGLSIPLPAASQPMRRTPGSPMKEQKEPIALEPPPTQAMTASGSFPSFFRICSLISLEKGCGPTAEPMQ